MAISRSARRWLRLPGRVALVLGIGALSTAGARADTAEGPPHADRGDTLIRSEGGRIYLYERGRETELRLGATRQRDHLLRLLEERGPAGVELGSDPSLIMSGGGGAGFSLRDITKSVTDKPDPAAKNASPATPPRPSTKPEIAPHDSNTPIDKRG
jgi:hypothetical protein